MGSDTPAEVVIVGGGIGGLATAIALKKVGIRAEVFERAPELNEVGAGLSLWSNAMRALNVLGLDQALLAHGSVLARSVILTDRGKVITETSLAALSQKAGFPSLCTHRADLQQILYTALDPEQVHLASPCIGFEQDTNGVTVHFSDGRSRRANLLIGADGIRSVVRESLVTATPAPRYAGYFAFRGIAPISHSSLHPNTNLFIVGCGAHVGLFPCGTNRVYWFAAINAPQGCASPPGGPKKEALERLQGWTTPIPEILAATPENAFLRSDIIDRPPVWPWGQGRVTLVGDAIHPTTPNLGQGACQALEDAVFLAHFLQKRGPHPETLRNYESTRRERTAMITHYSWSMGKMWQWENPVAGWLRFQAMRSPLAEAQGQRLFEQLLCYEPPKLDIDEVI